MKTPLLFRRLKRIRKLKTELRVLYRACRDPRVPWYAKAIVGVTVAYVLSPIDLIPDFIPFVGILDDAVVVPLGLALATRLIPPSILAEHRTQVVLGSTDSRDVAAATFS
jgi:uncharacterized membrane protein YkvA (DUF1232 family)